MNNILIRKSNLDDVNKIQHLNNELFKLEKENYDSTLVSDWPLTEEGRLYFEDLIENHFVIVATLNEEIVAYLAGSINDKGSYEEIQYGEINNMLVTDKCRGLGIGKLLVDEFKKYCKENNIENLKVEASAKNINAINFYQKNGFGNFNVTLTMNIKEQI